MRETQFCRHCGCTLEEPCRFEAAGAVHTCSWADLRHTLCTAPACTQWRLHFESAALRELAKSQCACGAWKKAMQSFCSQCWHALPWEIGGALYTHTSLGYALVYFDSMRWLIDNTSRLKDVSEDLRVLAVEVIGAAARERES
jgi:hypothetical protein